MAKTKVYRVLRAISSADKEGNAVHITRENERQIPDLLTGARIAELVKAGVLEEDGEDSAGHVATDAVTAAPSRK